MIFSRITACGKLLILFIAHIELAHYDPEHPPAYENFNVANARSLGFITCLGNKSDQQLPSILPTHQGRFFNPKTKTMQQLCAKPQYGGGNPFEHVGGYCGRSSIESEQNLTGFVLFDVSFGAKVNTYLAAPRMLAECSFRCFCSNITVLNETLPEAGQRDNIYIQPEFIAATDRLIYDRAVNRLDSTFQTRVDVIDNYSIQYPLLDKYLYKLGPGESSVWVDATIDSFDVEVVAQFEAIDENDVPDLIDTHSYIDGNAEGQSSISLDPPNAGGYCYNGPNGEREVFFSDEMTLRKDWTWDNLPISAAIPFHCWINCYCSDPPEMTPKQQNVTQLKMWNILIEPSVQMGIFQTSDGSIRLETVVTKDGTTDTTNVQIVPAYPLADGPNTCGSSGSQLCLESWPSSIAAKPTAPPGIPDLAYDASTQSAGTCGLSKTCTSQASCGTSDKTCKCTEPDSPTAQRYGLDPVFPSPLCLAITALIVGGKKSSQPGLGGRGLFLGGTRVMLNGDGEAWKCLCNSTYTSTACCLVDNGIVWEEAV
ncbi:hypothetical protein JMJ35_007992 [Cladonia borealis]|uniref:Uncharacterized protein n=1 Tax=Cladonia borealis TaxID=184061 RepID=A0AA39QUU8_9LECA|nr:hypothetical protein JMJ35_007992 [Cladonia borealis]